MREVFWEAFDNAEGGGEETIKVIASMMYQSWKDHIEELTEFVMVVNHKSWNHYERGNTDLCDLYAELYYEYYEKVINMLEKEGRDEDITYFVRTLD